jgi:hypothetical protein
MEDEDTRERRIAMTPARAKQITEQLRPDLPTVAVAAMLIAVEPDLEAGEAEALAREAQAAVRSDDEDAFAADCDARQQAHDDFGDYATEHDSEADHGYANEYMNRPGRWD